MPRPLSRRSGTTTPANPNLKCGQNPDCGHPECADALARYAAPHRLDERRFHEQVNVIMIEPHLRDRYDKAS
jgi:hypothetical protein